MTRYTLVGFPQHDSLEKLDTIRNYLYINWFRYTNKQLKGHSHITLAQVEISDGNNTEEIKNQFQEQFQNQWKFKITYKEVINREHKRIYDRPEFLEKYPNWCSRVALFFEDRNLKKLAQKLITFSKELGIDTTYHYAQNIANSQWKNITEEDSLQYIADHMNICNYARLEKAEEAREYFIEAFKGDIIIDKIWLVSETEWLQRTISFGEKVQ